MLLRDVQRLTALRAMQDFLDASARALRGFDSGGARDALDEVTERLGLLHIGQNTHDIRARGERYNERGLSNTIRRKFFRVLVDAAKVKKSGLEQLRPIKFPYRRTNTTALVLEARAVITTARPFTREIDRFIGPGWLDKFEAAATRLEASTDMKGGSRVRRVGATGAIDVLIKRARLVVSAVDALVVRHLPDGHALLAEWKSLVRAFRSAGRKKKAGKSRGS